ncbi:MAG TPA: hypothetical protein VHV31_09155 [Nitrolancea sp.]|nr:hypothetical protein [Nitrolancea sp.]
MRTIVATQERQTKRQPSAQAESRDSAFEMGTFSLGVVVDGPFCHDGSADLRLDGRDAIQAGTLSGI